MVRIEKKIVVNRDFILSRISEYDIFRMYYPYQLVLNRAIRSPFKDDGTPSFIIGTKYDNAITFKAFNGGNKGDCFHFVEQLFGLTYDEALNKIAHDFHLIDGTSEYKNIIKLYDQPIETKKATFFQAIPKKWTQAHHEFFAQYSLKKEDLQFCKDTKCYATGEWAKDRQRQPLPSNEVSFFYHLTNERGSWVKIYRPEQTDKKKKWRSSIPFIEMHGLSNLNGAKIGFVQKSMKDGAFTAKYISPHVAVCQAEDASALTNENIKYINENCETVYVIFDADEKGVEACTEITNETGWKYINPPKHLLQYGITDFTDWAKKEGSPYPIIDYFKQKGIAI